MIIENVQEALSEPGEWYLDRPSGTLTYLPKSGEDPNQTEVIAPRVETLVQLQGDPGAGRWGGVARAAGAVRAILAVDPLRLPLHLGRYAARWLSR